MQKHFEKLQQEKEDAAMSKLQSLMPQLGSIVRDLALKEVDWNVDKAALLLRRFQVSNASKLTLLQRVIPLSFEVEHLSICLHLFGFIISDPSD